MPRRQPTLAAAALFAAAILAGAPDSPVAREEPPTQPPAAAPPGAEGTYVGAEACAGCHQEIAAGHARTPHGRTATQTWAGVAGCESCHGPGGAHAESGGDVDAIRRLSKLPAEDQSAACLACHERGDRVHWQGSPHEGRGLSCLTCHRIHHPSGAPIAKGLLLKGSEFDTCGACHLKRKASLMRSAHMPLREGSMSCSSCHNAHGTTSVALLRQDSVNENCYSCHAEKRTPVLWEHPPVRENCLNCHDPHGSLHPRMQIAKQPRMCQQCHDEARHPTQPYSDASAGPEFFPNSRMFDRGCVNCHSQIHGSSHPAGMRFLR
ncbi:MAG TPA: DmsE family decaheme c-type cytochrome [Candidatus Polarisedimenticolia bacterium]|nr:DmsE family decaheme c-type cytochrome [Candidatus Polarisedimenticolia bacterium]